MKWAKFEVYFTNTIITSKIIISFFNIYKHESSSCLALEIYFKCNSIDIPVFFFLLVKINYIRVSTNLCLIQINEHKKKNYVKNVQPILCPRELKLVFIKFDHDKN